MTTPVPFPCPHCDTLLDPGVAACTSCGLRLVGPEAARLWQVNQQRAVLRAEAARLVEVLLAPAGAAPYAASYAGPYAAPQPGLPVQPGQPSQPSQPSQPGQPVGAFPAPYPAQGGRPPAPARSLSGQQVLLGLGALLLLSAASFFLLVVWFLVGVVGQAAIMVVLTGAAVGGSVLATRRRLPAAAETAAVIATGLLTLDLGAAYWLDLAGLGDLRASVYWTGAGLLGGAALLGFDRVVPRHDARGALRRVLVYRPAATTVLASAGWAAVLATEPDGLLLCALALVLAAASLGGAWVARRADVSATSLPVPASVVPLLLSALVALLVHLLTGLVTGYDPSTSGIERYVAVALLLVVPVAVLLVARDREVPALGAVLWLVPVLGVPVLDAHRLVLVAVSVLLAAALTALPALRPTSAGPTWASAAKVVAWALQPVLALVVLAASGQDATSGLHLVDDLADTAPAAWWVPVVPALAWAVATVAAAVRTRSVVWVGLAEVAVWATLATALRDADSSAWWPVALVLVAANLALAALTARSTGARTVLEGVTLGSALVWSAIAVAAGEAGTAYELAGALIAVGVLVIVYSATPGRLLLAYAGSLAVSAGIGQLTAEAGVETVEAYTAPLVLLLAGIGFVQWTRDRSLPTFVTTGPALGVALLPSLGVAVDQGDALRLLLVTVAGVVALGVGLLRHWQAPVTVGAVVLVVVAVTQGGPLIAYVPGWIILGGAGAVLLAAGVAWEQAVVAGRRAQAWYSTLK